MHPLDPAPRTAILVPGFCETRTVRTFAGGWTRETARFHPTAVAGPLNAVLELARRGIRLKHSVIVFSPGFDSCLTGSERDKLWRAFGVPVFEQVLGPGNELLASECEAHDGLHVILGSPRLPLDRTKCGCGSILPRVIQMETLQSLRASA